MAYVYVLTPLSLEEATDRLDSFYEALLDHEDEVLEGDLEIDIELLDKDDLPKRFSGRKGSAPKARDVLDQVRLCRSGYRVEDPPAFAENPLWVSALRALVEDKPGFLLYDDALGALRTGGNLLGEIERCRALGDPAVADAASPADAIEGEELSEQLARWLEKLHGDGILRTHAADALRDAPPLAERYLRLVHEAGGIGYAAAAQRLGASVDEVRACAEGIKRALAPVFAQAS
jgi:hypothetical protein